MNQDDDNYDEEEDAREADAINDENLISTLVECLGTLFKVYGSPLLPLFQAQLPQLPGQGAEEGGAAAAPRRGWTWVRARSHLACQTARHRARDALPALDAVGTRPARLPTPKHRHHSHSNIN
jgi:hypothetical protein